MKEKRIECFDDMSNERGFQFEFFCEHCRKSYRSEFVSSKAYNSEKRKRNTGAAASFIGGLFGGIASAVGDKIDQGLTSINDHTDDSQYDSEKEAALLKAQAEAQKVLFQCKECEAWFCEDCYNSKTQMCENCDEAVKERERDERRQREEERLDREREEREREEERRQQEEEESRVFCPNCGAEIPEGMKFCGQCGTKMDAVKTCPKCKKKNEFSMQFCGYCGAKLKEK